VGTGRLIALRAGDLKLRIENGKIPD
jgi:hypothetical protein